METEIWKSVIGYEGYYEVSNLWNIKSINRIINAKCGSVRLSKWKLLKPWVDSFWRKIIVLSKGNKQWTVFVSRLVWQAFLWLKLNNKHMLVCHKDDNPSNNEINNLFLWTNQDNYDDMVSKGRRKLRWLNYSNTSLIKLNVTYKSLRILWYSYSNISYHFLKNRNWVYEMRKTGRIK